MSKENEKKKSNKKNSTNKKDNSKKENLKEVTKSKETKATKEERIIEAEKNIADMGLENAELKKLSPLKFACRCSPERAASMIGALDEKERSALPPKIDITCHMCGRTFTVSV